jgi:hypothetical protein
MAVPELADWLRGLSENRLSWGGDWLELYAGIWSPPAPARLDGVWWGISARDAQGFADTLGARLLTPLFADLTRDRATLRLNFRADRSSGSPDMAGEAAMRRYSADLAAAVRAAGYDPDAPLPLVCLGAKDWVITRDLETGRSSQTGKALPYGAHSACNYGAFVRDGFEASITGRYRVIQSPGYAHNDAHRDYSQLLRLVYVVPGTAFPAHDGATLTRLPSVPAPAPSGPRQGTTGAGGGLAALALAALGLGL